MHPINVTFATTADLSWLTARDRHISAETLAKKAENGEILIAREVDTSVGWLRYSLFWDQCPFINMLVVLESHRGAGIGTKLVTFFENEMHRRGFTRIMTSSLANEQGQRFFRRRGYTDCGCLLLPHEPLEILFRKELLAPAAVLPPAS